MTKVSAHFDPKADEPLKSKAAHCHLLQDTVTGIVYQKELGPGEIKGSWSKKELVLPRTTEFVTGYKPVSGLKTIMGNVKHLFECIYCNTMKVASQYLAIESETSFEKFAGKVKVCDVAGVYSGDIEYYLLIHVAISSNFFDVQRQKSL